ncbi:hypothetical protein CDD83_3764 [Cordyceps sp. RAO-2017]|nr:hypothetical protein CDD83_3764 [Cordyceps sp. RAO-2017]
MQTFIDLTTEDDLPPPPPPPSSRPQGQTFGLRVPCDEPPAKRRRSDDAAFKKRDLKACVQEHVLPHVVRAVARLSREEYAVDSIAIQAVTTLTRSPSFRMSMAEAATSNLPLYYPGADLAAADVVEKLMALPQYQIQSQPASVREKPPAGATEIKIEQDQTTLSKGPSPNAAKLKLEPRPRLAFRPRNRTKDPDAPQRPYKWLRIKARPYLPAAERDLILQGTKRPLAWRHDAVETWPLVYHVDFTSDEIGQIFTHLSTRYNTEVPQDLDLNWLTALCHRHHVASIVGDGVIPGRSVEDLRNFFTDLMADQACAPDRATVFSLEREVRDARRENRRNSRIPSLLLAREMEGNARFGRMRRFENFQNEFKKAHEDGLSIVAEFTNCAGDISAMSWVPDGNILCGTTAHSDSHNQQYNKPGNLVLCSTSQGTLRAFADHRIPRPLVDKGENSTEAMRQSQDPWLYSSVVSSDYDEVRGRAYTSSFDKTVKVWDIAKDGGFMRCIATWHHDGNVNFVSAAKDGSGRVASAADVPTQAIRVYTIRADDDDVDGSPFQAISCTRTDADGSDMWAYFPATMQWGRAPGTTHLLIVGYSPRGLANDDRDIPEDKKNSGEIMIWDAARGCRVPVMTATTANVFEVIWHPRLPRFVAATSPCGIIEHGVRTQIHLFQLDLEREDGAYSEFQKLDCFASDINELTIMPNSLRHAYVTAGCTDGRTYVWDTAQGDHPVHILQHGYPLDDYSYDREKEDTGVKFTAWGTTPDRLYTGSSDGVVKVWNVRNERPFVRNLLEAPGPISIGAFSPDYSQLAIGDATGRLFLLSLDERDQHGANFTTLPGTNRRIRRPKPFIPHPEPPPPPGNGEADADESDAEGDSELVSAYARRRYLDSGQLVLHRNPVVGAVQGPAYASTGLFRREAHLGEEPTAPLLTEYERLQRESEHASGARRRRSERRLKNPLAADGNDEDRARRHAANRRLDLDGLRLEFAELWDSMRRERAVLTADEDEDWGFAYEEMPEWEAGA